MTAAALRWHLPRFEQWQCASGTMTDRERLGFPDHLVVTDLQALVATGMAGLRMAPVSTLLGIIDDRQAALEMRIASGNLLALAGDPRIDPLAPATIAIPGGEVEIGLSTGEIDAVTERLSHLGIARSWIAKEAPRHRVALRPFDLARFAVTNAEYRLFLLETGHPELPSSWEFRRYPAERANHPVHTVSAGSADAYAGWLSEKTGLAWRLPTEAEWEHAAAGPEGREYPWGAAFDPICANTAECGLLNTAPVGAFLDGASPLGVLDMGGNVEEYVASDYAPYPEGDPVNDHLVQIHGTYRIARGGCFSRFSDLARARRRHGHNPRSAAYAMGFRLARSGGPAAMP